VPASKELGTYELSDPALNPK